MFLCLALAVILFACIATASWVAGSTLSAPANHVVAQPPQDLHVQNVEFDGIKGWIVPSLTPSDRCVILMHGVRSDRSAMLNRAEFLRIHGYTSLLFDFQAHGESQGDQITFGYLESNNAHSALKFLRSTGLCTKIAAIGQSLGGAAALLGKQPLDVDALVLESVYPSLKDAVIDRVVIRFGSAGTVIAPLLYWQIPYRIGAPLSEFEPAVAIARIKCPVYIIAGSEDQHTSLPEAELIYKNAPNPKQFWEVKGAAHVDMYTYSGKQYETNVLEFLSHYI